METHLIKLNNILNRKRIDYIEIQGTCNKAGRIKQQFTEIMKYEDEYDYYVTLTSGQFSSLFPNIIKDINDKFYYIENSEPKVITFTEGAYEVEDINAQIQLTIPNEAIKLIVDQGFGRCKVFLKSRYKIDFRLEITFRNLLGFDAIVIDQPYSESPKICDLVISTNLYIHLDIIKGSIFQVKPSDIVYSFANDIPFGHSINLKLQFKREHLLLKKIFFRNKYIFY